MRCERRPVNELIEFLLRVPRSNTEIQRLEEELKEFNERIIELEDQDHRGHAMKVLKAKAIDFARQIDELRCLLIGRKA